MASLRVISSWSSAAPTGVRVPGHGVIPCAAASVQVQGGRMNPALEVAWSFSGALAFTTAS